MLNRNAWLCLSTSVLRLCKLKSWLDYALYRYRQNQLLLREVKTEPQKVSIILKCHCYDSNKRKRRQDISAGTGALRVPHETWNGNNASHSMKSASAHKGHLQSLILQLTQGWRIMATWEAVPLCQPVGSFKAKSQRAFGEGEKRNNPHLPTAKRRMLATKQPAPTLR